MCARDALPVYTKDALADVQVIQVKLFLKTHAENTSVTAGILIIQYPYMHYIKYTCPLKQTIFNSKQRSKKELTGATLFILL